MRVEASVTSISWIPSEAIVGMPKLPFEIGIGHYDDPPPDELAPGALDELLAADRFREANELKAWVEVVDGSIIDQGYAGRGLVGATTFTFGAKQIVVPGVAFDVLQAEAEVGDDSVRFVQTVGGRAGFPAPRRVKDKPFMRVSSATAWTTLALTINANGTSEHELVGASPFPRHWIYDTSGALTHKSGVVDFKAWYREAHGEHTPWGNEDSEAFVTQAESKLERQLSRWLMKEQQAPERRVIEPGSALVEQGERSDDLYLLLDGVLAVEIDGTEVGDIGPGAVLGERAVLDGGKRTATLRARTRSRVAVVPPELIDRASLHELASARGDRAQ
jgi:Cyclic nucleotide-binding domain